MAHAQVVGAGRPASGRYAVAARRVRLAAASLVAVGALGLGAPAAFAATAPLTGSSAAAPGSVVLAAPAASSAGASTAQLHPVAAPVLTAPTSPSSPSPPAAPGAPGISLQVDGGAGRTQSVTIIALLTVLSVAPALLLMCTSFTKIAVVLALTRQALGTPTIPPNQVLAGLALFLSLFVMSPVLAQSYNDGVKPYLNSSSATLDDSRALEATFAPMRTFMLQHTGKTELQTMITLSKEAAPATREQVSATTLIPAFVLSELKTAFIIGFVIFIPFLIIDLVVASILMSMGMMMLPPVMISLPFKLLLFIMVDGWSLIASALVTSYR